MVELRGGLRLAAVFFYALFTAKFMPQIWRPAFQRLHPRSVLPRRIVPHVLPVPTLQIGYPVAALILMERNNLAQNSAGHRLPHGKPKLKSEEPAATTTYCFPFTPYVIGDEYTDAPH